MYFVISGAGEVGLHVAKTLRAEQHEVVLIESDRAKVSRIAEQIDAMVLEGSGADLTILEEAGIHKADQFLAMTGDDEVNMVAATIAHGYGVTRTIARVNAQAYIDSSVTGRYRRIGIDAAVCPELVAAEKIYETLRAPSLMNVETFADKVALSEIRVDPAADAVGKRIRDIVLPPGVNFVAVNHGGDDFVAKGDIRIHADDKVLLAMTRQEAAMELEGLLGRPRYVQSAGPLDRVTIGGATRLGVHLARMLERDGRDVTVVEADPERARTATETLDRSLVIQASTTERSVLIDENVGECDAFVGATGSEEENVLACLIAKRLGVRKTVALIEQPELRDIVEAIHIDLAITPRLATVGAVLRQVYKAETMDLVLTREGNAQIIEYMVHDRARVADKKVSKAHIPRHALVAAIIRGDEVILPRGDDVFLPGDRAVVYTHPEEVPRLEKLFA